MKGQALLLALSAALALSFAGSAAAAGDKAIGGGKTLNDIFNLSAQSGPLGQNASGHMRAKNTRMFEDTPFFDFELGFDVTCMTTVGHLAAIGGRTTHLAVLGFPNYNPQTFPGMLFFVEDNQALGIPDEISFEFPLTTVPAICPPPNPATSQFPLTNGNINVVDALF
jgi:hypothetical protein